MNLICIFWIINFPAANAENELEKIIEYSGTFTFSKGVIYDGGTHPTMEAAWKASLAPQTPHKSTQIGSLWSSGNFKQLRKDLYAFQSYSTSIKPPTNQMAHCGPIYLVCS